MSRLERVLANILHYGTGLASAVIALGVALMLATSFTHGLSPALGPHIMTAGIALFLLLPVLRVMTMLLFFLRERDYPFSAIAALVLLLLFLGCALGMRLHSATAG